MSRLRRHGRSHATPLAVGVLMAFVAWLSVLAHLAGTLHFALISHEICADHGELVHRSAARAGEHQHPRGPAALPSGENGEHDHCPLIGRRNDQQATVSAPALEVAPAAVGLVPVLGESPRAVPSRAALLLAAPKQSPPA
jgi:hypothetical protein